MDKFHLWILISAGGALLGGGEEHQGQVLQCLQVQSIINCFQHYFGNLELSSTSVNCCIFFYQHEPCHRMIIALGIGIVQIENYSLPPSCAIITTIVIIVFSSSNNSIINHHCQSPQNLDLLRKKLQEVPGIRCQGETRSRSCNGGANISTPFVNSWAKRLSHISHQIELMFQWNLLQ